MTPSALSMAKVVAFREKNRADILMLDTGARIPRVRIMAGMGGTNVGRVDTPPPTPGAEEYSPLETKDRDIYAAVAYIGNIPMIMGFIYPEVSQLFFADLGRSISRDGSDVYSSIDADGNLEVYHPSGTYLRIAVDPEHEDLTGADIDGKWKIEKNTDKAVHVRLRVANAGEEVALVEITPEGNGQLHLTGDLTAQVDGNLSATVTGSMTTSAASWTHTGPVTFIDDVQVNKTLTATTDVVGGGKSLKGHKHTAVQAGGGVSGPPQ